MMFTRPGVLLLTLAWLGACLSPVAGGLVGPAEYNRLRAQLETQPMVFFVAKGPADSCGPGCNEWIAAQGVFQAGTAQSFKDFIKTLDGRKLPVFFHSPGGLNKDALEIGFILHQFRMTAGIGRTRAAGCDVFDQKDSACQRLIKAGESVKAQLLADGQCHSACVYAFLGGATRKVSVKAVLGIHSPYVDPKSKKSQVDEKAMVADTSRYMRRYLVQMGIDPRLQDLTVKVRPQDIYVLSRDEIAGFGIESRELYETPWLYYEDSPARFMILKSVTQRVTVEDRTEYLTTRFNLLCDLALNLSSFGYYRDLPWKHDNFSLKLKLGERSISFWTRGAPDRTESGIAKDFPSNRVLILKTEKLKDITLVENFSESEQHPAESRQIDLSALGLSEAVVEFDKKCILKSVAAPPWPTGNAPPKPVEWPHLKPVAP